MTRKAWAFVVFTSAMWVTALSTGADLYYYVGIVMGMMLALSLASAVFAWLAIQVQIFLPARSVERGEPIPVKVRVRHRSVIPLSQLILTMALEGEPDSVCRWQMAGRAWRWTHVTHEFCCLHRGVYRMGVQRCTVSDVFGLFRFSRRPREGTATVVVRPVAWTMESLPLRPGEEGVHIVRSRPQEATQPSDVREWQAGDALTHIHWKLSVQRMQTMVRTYEESARPDTVIVPDFTPIEGDVATMRLAQDAITEIALNVARAQWAEGNPVRLSLYAAEADERWATSAAEAESVAEALARVAFDAEMEYEWILAQEMAALHRTGALVLVTTRGNAQVMDIAVRIRRSGVPVFVFIVSEVAAEVDAMIAQMKGEFVEAERVCPSEFALTDTGEANP